MKHVVQIELHVTDAEVILDALHKAIKIYGVCIECVSEYVDSTSEHLESCALNLAMRNMRHSLHCDECGHTSVNNYKGTKK